MYHCDLKIDKSHLTFVKESNWNKRTHKHHTVLVVLSRIELETNQLLKSNHSIMYVVPIRLLFVLLRLKCLFRSIIVIRWDIL